MRVERAIVPHALIVRESTAPPRPERSSKSRARSG
jgi:hypothetical protein